MERDWDAVPIWSYRIKDHQDSWNTAPILSHLPSWKISFSIPKLIGILPANFEVPFNINGVSMVDCDVTVTKFIGSYLVSWNGAQRVALKVKRTVETSICAAMMVSIFKEVTDQSPPIIDESTKQSVLVGERDDVASLGELFSTRAMFASLRSFGVNAVVVDPYSNYWLTYVDCSFGGDELLLEEAREAANEKIKSLLDLGVILVVCDFLGLNFESKASTLEGMGNNTTAVLLEACLGAKEVVPVKDVEGMLGGDPAFTNDSQVLDVVDAKEADSPALSGVKITHAKALRKPKSLKLNDVCFSKGASMDRGRRIFGSCNLDVAPSSYETPILAISVLGDDIANYKAASQILSDLSAIKAKVLLIVFDNQTPAFYVLDRDVTLDQLHCIMVDSGLGKAVVCFDKLAMIVNGKWTHMNDALSILAEDGVFVPWFNVDSRVKIFVEWNNRLKTVEKLKKYLKKYGRCAS